MCNGFQSLKIEPRHLADNVAYRHLDNVNVCRLVQTRLKNFAVKIPHPYADDRSSQTAIASGLAVLQPESECTVRWLPPCPHSPKFQQQGQGLSLLGVWLESPNAVPNWGTAAQHPKKVNGILARPWLSITAHKMYLLCCSVIWLGMALAGSTIVCALHARQSMQEVKQASACVEQHDSDYEVMNVG